MNVSAMDQYDALLENQAQDGTLPLFADSARVQKVKDVFMSIFKEASEGERSEIADRPLFPKNTRFTHLDDCVKAGAMTDSAHPINYVLFCADLDALQLIDPYLDKHVYQRRGPYKSTFMHCLLSGIEKGSSNIKQVVECAQFLLKKDPSLAKEENGLNTTPKEYADWILTQVKPYKEILKSVPAGKCSQIFCEKLEQLIKLLS
jgi:hypothetical protein